MSYSYVLINAEPSYDRQIMDEMSDMDKVEEVNQLLVEDTAEADPLFEKYNLMVKIKAENKETLKKIIEQEIKEIKGVKQVKIITKPEI